jgi:hypothetical protein
MGFCEKFIGKKKKQEWETFGRCFVSAIPRVGSVEQDGKFTKRKGWKEEEGDSRAWQHGG